MQFLFAEQGKKEEFFTRYAEPKLFMYITPQVKTVNFSTGVNDGYISFIKTLPSPTSQTSFTKVCFLYKLTEIQQGALTWCFVMLAFSQTGRAAEKQLVTICCTE